MVLAITRWTSTIAVPTASSAAMNGSFDSFGILTLDIVDLRTET